MYSQPWFPGWQEFRGSTQAQRNMTVSSLLHSTSRVWDFDQLQQLFGYSRALIISTLESIKPAPAPASDTLLITFSKDGRFSVRKAYQLLKGSYSAVPDKDFWEWIWSGIALTPKLKMFIWRSVHGALPVMAVLVARIGHLSPTCPLCKREQETVMHTFFHCEFA